MYYTGIPALGIAAMDSYSGNWLIMIALVAGVSIILVFARIVFMGLYVQRDEGKFDSFAGFDPDDAVIIIPFVIIVGYGEWLLLCTAICAPVALLIITMKFYRHRQQAGS